MFIRISHKMNYPFKFGDFYKSSSLIFIVSSSCGSIWTRLKYKEMISLYVVHFKNKEEYVKNEVDFSEYALMPIVSFISGVYSSNVVFILILQLYSYFKLFHIIGFIFHFNFMLKLLNFFLNIFPFIL